MKKLVQRVLFFLKEYKHGVVTVLLMAVIADILFIRYASDPITFSILGLIVVMFKFYQFTSKNIFSLGIIPLVIMSFGFLLDPASFVADKASVWLFLLIGIGIVQELFLGRNHETA